MGIINPSYLSGFIDSVCYNFERNGNAYDRNHLANSIVREAKCSKQAALAGLHRFATRYVEHGAQRGSISHSCHAISDGFMKTLSNATDEPLPIAITIGDVWFRGKKKYGVTRSKIDQLIRAGFDKSRFVDVHVWLTLSDMTVIDLTILPTLRADGELEAKTEPGSDGILICREDEPSDYLFEPLLVDNDFFSKVERGLYQIG
jgi:hypothetical protein